MTWSHYLEILKADDELEIGFYCAECIRADWDVRELGRQMKSMLFHRVALSKDKATILRLANEGAVVQRPEDVFRDHYVLEFAGIKPKSRYGESDLHNKVDHYDVGQMNLYLNYFKSEEGTKFENPPIGIILAAEKDDLTVEFATQGITNKIFVSRYQLYLPDKEQLRRELAIALEEETRRLARAKRKGSRA